MFVPGLIAAGDRDRLARPEAEPAGTAVERSAEDARRVEAGHAHPLDRAVRGDQGPRVAIREEAVVGDRAEIRGLACIGHALTTIARVRIAVAADERVGHRRGGGRRAAPPRARAARPRRARRRRSATTGHGRARRPPATSPRAAPSRRSSAAGPAPAPRSRPTRSPGIRAALCGDAATAEGARRWNDANVLALSLRTTSEAELAEILDAWFAGDAERRRRRPGQRRAPRRDRVRAR